MAPAQTVLVTTEASASQNTARTLSVLTAAGIVTPAGVNASGRSPLVTNKPPLVVVALVVAVTMRRSSMT